MGMGERRGGGYDHERGGIAPEEGTWRSRAPLPRAGGGGYGDRFGDRDSGRMGGGGGYDDRRGGRDGGRYDVPPPTERKRLQLQSRTVPPPLPPMSAKEPDKPAPAPAPKPSGSKSNPFGAAHAVDTTQRDREIEAKLEAERHGLIRRRDESVRSIARPTPATRDMDTEEAVSNAKGADGEVEQKVDVDDDERVEVKPEGPAEANGKGAEVEENTAPEAEDVRETEKPVPAKPVGRWAALRREGGGDDRPSHPPGSFSRRDRDDRSSFGKRGDGYAGPGGGGFNSSRRDREPMHPQAPPAGNAFAKRFGSNFDRDSRPSAGGRGFDPRDDHRGRSVGMGPSMGMGPSKFSRDRDEYQRRSGPGSPLERPSPGRFSGGSNDSSPPVSSFSRMAVKETKEVEPIPEPEPEPEPEVKPTQEPETEPEAEPEPELEPEPEPEPVEDPEEVARASAEEALATNKRGKELQDFVMAQEKRTTAGALLTAAMKDISTPQDMKWAKQEELGAALVALSEDNTEEQVGIIYAVVAKCHEMGFPKGTNGAVVQTIFMGMYNCDLCEEEAFIEWKVSSVKGFRSFFTAFPLEEIQ